MWLVSRWWIRCGLCVDWYVKRSNCVYTVYKLGMEPRPMRYWCNEYFTMYSDYSGSDYTGSYYKGSHYYSGSDYTGSYYKGSNDCGPYNNGSDYHRSDYYQTDHTGPY